MTAIEALKKLREAAEAVAQAQPDSATWKAVNEAYGEAIEDADEVLKAAGGSVGNPMTPAAGNADATQQLSPAVLDWADVLAFYRRTFPEAAKKWADQGVTDERMIAHIKDSWGAGPFYFPVDGKGNWFSRVLQPAYERQDRLAKTEAALGYARKVIENYAMDIRSKPELVAAGFCQGCIYTEALADIARIQRDGA